jgi:hypothetical protein
MKVSWAASIDTAMDLRAKPCAQNDDGPDQGPAVQGWTTCAT